LLFSLPLCLSIWPWLAPPVPVAPDVPPVPWAPAIVTPASRPMAAVVANKVFIIGLFPAGWSLLLMGIERGGKAVVPPFFVGRWRMAIPQRAPDRPPFSPIAEPRPRSRRGPAGPSV